MEIAYVHRSNSTVLSTSSPRQVVPEHIRLKIQYVNTVYFFTHFVIFRQTLGVITGGFALKKIQKFKNSKKIKRYVIKKVVEHVEIEY